MNRNNIATTSKETNTKFTDILSTELSTQNEELTIVVSADYALVEAQQNLFMFNGNVLRSDDTMS